MKPLIITLAGFAVVVVLAAGPAEAQGREQGGGGASAGASAGARTGGGGDGGSSRAGSSGSVGASPAGSSSSSSGGGYAGAPAGWSGPGSSSSGSSSAGRGTGSYGSPYSGAGARVNPANGNSAYVREVYGTPGDRAVPRGARPNPGAPTVGQAGLRPENPGYRPPGIGGGPYPGYPGYPYNPYWGWAGGYYGWYDPWWWWGWGWDGPVALVGDGGYYNNEVVGRGGLKLKVEPAFAEVYVDGYYMGIVDDFNGALQKMDLEVGAHHVEIRAPGYQTITIDVRIEFDQTVTYRGQLQPLAKK